MSHTQPNHSYMYTVHVFVVPMQDNSTELHVLGKNESAVVVSGLIDAIIIIIAIVLEAIAVIAHEFILIRKVYNHACTES